MVEPISSTEFDATGNLVDWRVLLRRIEATYTAPTFAAASRFVAQVAAAADAAGHHPDIDLRYPGRVHVTLTTHATAGLTDLDVDLARQISGLAAQSGVTSEPPSTNALEVAIDAMDIPAVRPFWKAVLGYEDEPPRRAGDPPNGLVDPLRIGPAFWFQQMDVERPQRNRIHLDVTVAHDIADGRIAAAIAAGGHLVSDGAARAFWILADVEGNEACICTWQDRD